MLMLSEELAGAAGIAGLGLVVDKTGTDGEEVRGELVVDVVVMAIKVLSHFSEATVEDSPITGSVYTVLSGIDHAGTPESNFTLGWIFFNCSAVMVLGLDTSEDI